MATEGGGKKVKDGLVLGLASAGKGILGGVTSMVSTPVREAKTGGLQGFATGLAKGLTDAVKLPVAGIVEGAGLISAGIRNSAKTEEGHEMEDIAEEMSNKPGVMTAEENKHAIVVDERFYDDARQKVMEAALKGMKAGSGKPGVPGGLEAFFEAIWNVRKRHEDRLAAAAGGGGGGGGGPPSPSSLHRSSSGEEIGPSSSPGPLASSTPPLSPVKRIVKETELYEVLGVDPSADSTEIKKAYYKLARQLHPDKQGMEGNPEATRKFQQLGEAYQVIADPEARAKYDKYGRVALEDGFVDPGSLFTMAFGSPKFQHLIGELTAAAAADGTLTEEQLKEFQQKRERWLAEQLKTRLQAWIDGDKNKFLEEARLEVVTLLSEPFGAEILQCVGYVYQQKANMLLGLHHSSLKLPGHIAFLRQQGHTFIRRVKAQRAVYRAAEFTERYEKERKSADGLNMTDEGIPLFLHSLWAVSVLDIESTLRHVISLVVLDESVPKEVRAARAKGIAALGKIFQEA